MNALLDSDDYPPYPSAGSPATLTYSQKGVRQLLAGLTPIRADADAEERTLAEAIDDLNERVAAAEAKAYHADPALLLSDTYQERAHEWVISKHSAEFTASLNFSRNLQNKAVNLSLNKVVDLIDMTLFIELANSLRFRPLFASVYDAVDLMRKTNRTAFQHFYNNNRNDILIGYTSEPSLTPISSLAGHLAELNKRYPLLLAKLSAMKLELGIPQDAFAGIKFGELYRLLDGIAQLAVQLRTPDEVSNLRQALRTKVIQWANLRAK